MPVTQPQPFDGCFRPSTFQLTGAAGSWSLPSHAPPLPLAVDRALPRRPAAATGARATEARVQPSTAQTVPAHAGATQPGAAQSGAAQPGASLTPEQARAALETLNDPKKRAAFAATLEALLKGQPADAPPPPPAVTPTPAATPAIPTGPSIELEPNSLGAQVLLTASAFLNEAADSVPRALKAVQSVPLLWGWMVVMVTNPLGQQLLADAAWRLAVTLALAGGIALALRYLLRRPMARVLALGRLQHSSARRGRRRPESRAELGAIEPPRRRRRPASARRTGLGIARFALGMVPVLGLLVVGHAVAASGLGGTPDSRLVILAVLEAIAVCQTLLAMLTLLFEPDRPACRVLPLRASTGDVPDALGPAADPDRRARLHDRRGRRCCSACRPRRTTPCRKRSDWR